MLDIKIESECCYCSEQNELSIKDEQLAWKGRIISINQSLDV